MDLKEAIDAVGTAADSCALVDVDGVDISEMRTRLAHFRTNLSRLEAQFARIAHSADRAGAHLGTGARDTAEWVGKQTGTSTRKNRTATDLGEAMAKSSDLADAVTSGTISNDQANAAVGASGGLTLDSDLIDEITTLPLASVRGAAESWRAANDSEREADLTAQQRGRRFLRLTGQADGMTRVEGMLDPDSASIIRTTLDSIISESAFDESNRRRDQRCVDALTQLAKAESKGKIRGGRSNAKLLATVPFETVVERAAARGVTHAGPTIDAAAVRQMACDAGIHRVITGPGSSILDFGRENRLVSENLFLALVARDHHCRWPGCTIRATWCDAHHVTAWGHQGRTDESTVALLCHYHHSVSHLPGWRVSGNAHEFTIHHPDGSTEVSRPPPVRTSRTGSGSSSADDSSGSPTSGSKPSEIDGPAPHVASPPGGPAPRADPIGRESTSDNAPTTGQLVLS